MVDRQELKAYAESKGLPEPPSPTETYTSQGNFVWFWVPFLTLTLIAEIAKS